MAARIQVLKLVNGVAIAGGGELETDTVDLRTGIERVNAIVARGIAAVSQPNYKVEWAGGITTAEVMGSPTGDTDRFQIFDAADVAVPSDNIPNEDLINTMAGGNFGLGSELWILKEMPQVLWPYIRFRITSEGGSPTATFDLFLIVQLRSS